MTNDRIAGAALIVAGGLSVLMMAHHPTSADAAGMGQFVHGALIALLAVMAYGFTHMARRMGLDRPAILMGLSAWWIGTGATIGAATISGFVATGLAAHGIDDGDLFMLAWESNQALARLGVVASGSAFLLWSLALIRWAGWPAKALAALGGAAGIAPVLLLGTGLLRMNLAGAILVYGMHAGWIVAAGFYLWSGRFTRDREV